MASYSFTRHESTEPIILNKLDELMVEDLNKLGEKDVMLMPEHNCYLMNWTVEIGFAILSYGGDGVTEIRYKQWREKSSGLDTDERFMKVEHLIKKYLYGEYYFLAWR